MRRADILMEVDVQRADMNRHGAYHLYYESWRARTPPGCFHQDAAMIRLRLEHRDTKELAAHEHRTVMGWVTMYPTHSWLPPDSRMWQVIILIGSNLSYKIGGVRNW